MEKRTEFSGKDVREALEAASSHYNRPVEDLKHEIMDKGRRGFLGIGRQPARISVLEEAGGPPRETGEGERLREILVGILRNWRIDLRYNLEEEDSRYKIDLYGRDRNLILDHNGKTLDSLQYLLNKILHHDERGGKRVVVDSRGFRSNRETELHEMARKSSEKVKRTGAKCELRPLNPYERRIVHMALKNDRGVETYSRGKGFLKRVTIKPAKGSKS